MPQTKATKAKRTACPPGLEGQDRREGRGSIGERERNKKERGFIDSGPARVSALGVLLAILTAPTLLPKYSVVDNDIWLHLKVGDWIVEHSTVPYTGILSRTAADRPWMAYSWLYELLLSRFHSWFGLAGISVYGLLVSLA